MKVKLVQEVVRSIRSLKQDYLPPKAKPEGLPPPSLPLSLSLPLPLSPSLLLTSNPPSPVPLTVYVVCKTEDASAILHQFSDVIQTLSRCSK